MRPTVVAASQAKFDPARAKRVCEWIEAVTGTNLDLPSNEEGISDQLDFGHALKDGIAICQLLNALQPGLVKKVNTMKAPFKQRENIEMFLKGCEAYGLKSQDLFQVNDLYENKNLYMRFAARGGMPCRVEAAHEGPFKGRHQELEVCGHVTGHLCFVFYDYFIAAHNHVHLHNTH
ncbi:hypothetical protein HAZT_HAZT003960 [Hyalella azteca]|uniref:Calponin-homology (CH) domain-containing protein n=1 Tax=Hyalella azteca TaxID=294128 RepID=A0A6A0H2Q1_HYAAZ|nr:hypothetical protein HAZT_HAZT003960 [Hyalella azteca]